jgi:hypothetical protein
MTHFIDRRLNPKGKSLANRQRFLRRARTQIRDAVQKSLKDAAVADIGKERKPRARASLVSGSIRSRAATRISCCPAIANSAPATRSRSPARVKASPASRLPIPATARTISNSP